MKYFNDKFKRRRQQNFYYFNSTFGVIMKSYNTIVAFWNKRDNALYEVKYSRTTTKQITSYARNCLPIGYERIEVKQEELKKIIETNTLYYVNTQYNYADVYMD